MSVLIQAAPLAVIAQLRQIYDRNPSMFQAVGPQSRMLASLGWTMTVIGVVVFLIVMALLLWPDLAGAQRATRRRRAAAGKRARVDPLRRRRGPGGDPRRGVRAHSRGVPRLGARPAAPAHREGHRTSVVVGSALSRSANTHSRRDSSPGRPAGAKCIIESDDVIHSFWVPNLAGKTDAIPGQDQRNVARGRYGRHLARRLRGVLRDAACAHGTERRGPASRRSSHGGWRSERAVAAAPTDSATLEGRTRLPLVAMRVSAIPCAARRPAAASGPISRTSARV